MKIVVVLMVSQLRITKNLNLKVDLKWKCTQEILIEIIV